MCEHVATRFIIIKFISLGDELAGIFTKPTTKQILGSGLEPTWILWAQIEGMYKTMARKVLYKVTTYSQEFCIGKYILPTL
jgi:hypothetical protein